MFGAFFPHAANVDRERTHHFSLLGNLPTDLATKTRSLFKVRELPRKHETALGHWSSEATARGCRAARSFRFEQIGSVLRSGTLSVDVNVFPSLCVFIRAA